MMTRNRSFSGVYCIVNTTTQRCYIGSSNDVFSRLQEHFRRLRAGNHKNSHLQTSFQKYGIDAFQWFVIEKCEISNKIGREQYWMDTLDTVKNGYNMRPRADATVITDEAKKKISLALMGHPVSEKTLLAMKVARLGLPPAPRTPEWKAKIAASLRGRKRPPFSDEWKRKVASKIRTQPVHCFTLDGRHVATFERIKDAMILTGNRRIGISLCIKERTKSAYGFIWRAA